MDKTRQILGAVALVLAAVVMLGLIYLEAAPEAVVNNEANQYSIENVYRHIENIASAPRPVGTEDHRRARKYLEDSLTNLGISPETQSTIAFNARSGTPYRAGYVTNIIGRIKGNGGGNTILLVAHYDSVSTGPGAADNASSVASILETLRILKTESPGENDVAVLFSDAEEVGTLGAKAFINETPWLSNVKAVINLEARGSSGASLLFETSENNSGLIKSYSGAVVHPVASSFFSDVYKILPNDTDFTEFKLKDVNGLNTAFIEEINNYHTAADNVKNLDKNSVFQQGENLLAIVRDLRNKNLTEAATGEQVFFDLFGKVVVRYPVGLVLPLMLAALVLYFAAVYFGRRTEKLTLKGIIIGFFLFLFYLLAGIIFSVLLVKIIAVFHKDYAMFITGDTYNAVYYIFGIMSLTTALAFVFYAIFGKKRTRDDLFFGGATLWLLLAILTSLVLPGTSYIFTLSSISVSTTSLIGFLWKDETSTDLKNLLIPLLGSFVGIVLIGGIIRHLVLGLGVGMIPVGVFFVALTFGLLIYAVLILERKTRLIIGGLLATVGIGLIILGLATTTYSPENPRQTSVFWALDADTQKAFWATEDLNPNEWNKAIFEGNSGDTQLPQILPQSRRFFLTKETALSDLGLPALEKISDETAGDSRRVKFKVASPSQSPVITLAIESAAEVTGFEMDGKNFSGEISTPERQKTPWAVRLYGVPAGGAEIVLTLKTTEPLKVRVITQNYGFPPSANLSINSRPADLVATPMPFNDSTFVTKLFVF